MIQLVKSVCLIAANLLLYFLFGSLFRSRKKPFSAVFSILSGFFSYYFLFELCCLPLMLRWKPLSLLSRLWTAVILIVCLASFIINRRHFREKAGGILRELRLHPWYAAFFSVLTFSALYVILRAYHFTLDASFYVANTTTSLQTDSLNIYNPYTGAWQDHFEFRYLLATYPLQDAVMCRLTGLHPLLWTKTVMGGTAIVLNVLVMERIGKELFREEYRGRAYFLFFCTLVHFFFSTIFTPSTFLITRTYEGKTLIGNIVLPFLFYLYLRLLKDDDGGRGLWLPLFLMSLGAPVLSMTANMLLLGAAAIYFIPLSVIKKDARFLLKGGISVLPSLFIMAAYVAYVRGYFVLYTYPK